MSRYRVPRPQGSNYITPQGKQRLESELDYLWRTKRPQITRSVSEAAAQGDRSENAEYIYGKKQLREIDARIRFLRKRLEILITVDRIPDEPERIFFGAWVELESEQGEILEFRIVGPDEFDRQTSYISMDAPLARALLGRQLDEEITVALPGGDKTFLITRIEYRAET